MRRIFLFILFFSILYVPCSSEARVYIDITSPAFVRLPIAVYDLQGGGFGRTVSQIVREDLDYSGVFEIVDPAVYVETPFPVFKSENWTPLGVEIVVKGMVEESVDQIKAEVHVFDVVEGRKIMVKKFRAKKQHYRTMAHTISDSIYSQITGKDSAFTTKIAFVRKKRQGQEVYIMDWDGRRLRSLGIKADILISLHWSKNKRMLLYSAERRKRWGVYLADLKRGVEHLIFRSKGVNLAGDFFPDGERFLFSSSRLGSPDLYLFDLKKRKFKRLTKQPGIEISPSVSPDGEWIAYVSDHTGSPQIFVMDIKGRNRRRISFTGGYNTSPVWSPKGDRIAYVSLIGKKNQIILVKTDGTDPIQLTEQGNNESPSFSPDGRFIAFVSDRDGKRRVYVMRANGEAQRPLTPKRWDCSSPAWTPFWK